MEMNPNTNTDDPKLFPRDLIVINTDGNKLFHCCPVRYIKEWETYINLRGKIVEMKKENGITYLYAKFDK